MTVLLVHGSPSQTASGVAAVGDVSPSNSALASPLDALSSADIAVTAARLADLSETTAVTNQAETVNAELAVAPTTASVAPKPQVVATALKSYKDIVHYTSQPATPSAPWPSSLA